MKHSIYIGERAELIGAGALLRFEGNIVLAQFDKLYFPEAFGWHEFQKSEFVIRNDAEEL